MNDKSIVTYDNFYIEILNGEIANDVEFTLYYTNAATGEIKLQRYQGAWIIVDNGYLPVSITVPPSKTSQYHDEYAWSKWIESVCKDVECTFGILKSRFQILRSQSRYHKIERMDNVWKTCCVIHNILLDYNVNEEEEYWLEEVNDKFKAIELQQQQAITVNMNMQNNNHRNIDDSNGVPNNTTYPNGCNVIIPVNQLLLADFKTRLIKHFAICKRFGQVCWKEEKNTKGK
jgi:hypothetical protein